jgi:hypothetical protein
LISQLLDNNSKKQQAFIPNINFQTGSNVTTGIVGTSKLEKKRIIVGL